MVSFGIVGYERVDEARRDEAVLKSLRSYTRH